MRFLNGLSDAIVLAISLLLNNIAVIVSMAAVCFIIYILVTSKPARLMVKALKNTLIKSLSQIPFVAKSLYDENIRKCRGMLRGWEDEEKIEQAKLEGYKRELFENQQQISKWEDMIQEALANGDELLAMEFAQNIVNTRNDCQRLEEDYIPDSEASIEEIHIRQSEARILIVRAKNAKKEALRNMERGRREEEHTDEMRERSDINDLIQNFEEKSKEQRDRAVGARKSFENTLEHKEHMLEQSVVRKEASILLEGYRQKAIAEKR